MKNNMKKDVAIIITLAFMIISCTSRKSSDNILPNDGQDVELSDSMRPDMPPPPDGMRPGSPPPPPPHGKGRPPHKPDNMRGFDPASEDDMDDNGMSRYMENNDEEGWD